MRTREEIAKKLSEISSQLIELAVYDLNSTEETQIREAESIIDNLCNSILEELSKNELAALENQNPSSKEQKGYFVNGYYFEDEESEEEAEVEAIASGVALSDFYGPDEY